MKVNDAKALVRKHGGIRAAARAVGMPESTLRVRLQGSVGRVVDDAPRARKSLADFRASYDKSFIVPQKIRAGLARLGRGWDYEVAFAKLCGLSLGDLGAYRDGFAEYVVQIGRDARRAWAGRTSTADAMRKML